MQIGLQIKTFFIRVYEAAGGRGGRIPQGYSSLKHHTQIPQNDLNGLNLIQGQNSQDTDPWLICLVCGLGLLFLCVRLRLRLIILCFYVFCSWEGDVTGEGLAQAMSEVWEVQKDPDIGLPCRGGEPVARRPVIRIFFFSLYHQGLRFQSTENQILWIFLNFPTQKNPTLIWFQPSNLHKLFTADHRVKVNCSLIILGDSLS